jgi:hypothetical protein
VINFNSIKKMPNFEKNKVMKRFFSLSFVLFAFISFSFAQSFEITDEDANVITNTTVLVPTHQNNSYVTKIKVRNTSAGTVSTRITKTYITGPVAGSFNSMCSPTTASSSGQCITGTTTPIFVLNAGELSGWADMDFTQGVNPGISTIQYKVFNINNEADSVIFRITYSTLTSVDLSDNDLFSVYPNPASKTFSIQHNYGNHAVVEVFNVLGKSVAKINSSAGNQISIDCSKWENGYYFCRLYNEGKIEKTVKLVVTH